LLKSGQLKGFPTGAIAAFCMRQYVVKNRKIYLETKKEFKKRFGRSPDEADAIAVLVEVAMQNGLSISSAAPEEPSKKEKELDDTASEVDYSPEEMASDYGYESEYEHSH